MLSTAILLLLNDKQLKRAREQLPKWCLTLQRYVISGFDDQYQLRPRRYTLPTAPSNTDSTEGLAVSHIYTQLISVVERHLAGCSRVDALSRAPNCAVDANLSRTCNRPQFEACVYGQTSTSSAVGVGRKIILNTIGARCTLHSSASAVLFCIRSWLIDTKLLAVLLSFVEVASW